MKMIKFSLYLMAAMALTLGISGSALAFHDGGVAYCDGCHTMHNSKNNVAMGSKAQFTGNSYLLQGSDQSSTCLRCHSTGSATPSSYHIMTYPVPGAGNAPTQLTPGGDFAYLGKTYSWTASYGAPGSSVGERHGHNINAVDFGLVPDTTLTSAPGGSYPNTSLSCISCHDPHSASRIVDAAGTMATRTLGSAVLPIGSSGSYGAMPTVDEAVGVYRLLGGVGYQPESVTGSFGFASPPPIAVAPSTYNRTEAATETRVAYGTGMSEWCANCHTNIHNDSLSSNLIHPASSTAVLPADIVTNYNAYVSSGDLTNTQATSYTSMVPYEEGTADRAALATHAVIDGSVTTGPTTGTENVMCLSCHRAHATAWDSMARWNNNAEFLTIAGTWPGTDGTGEAAYGQYATGKTMAEYQQAMYGRPATIYATYQRSLCNKCHAKD